MKTGVIRQILTDLSEIDDKRIPARLYFAIMRNKRLITDVVSDAEKARVKLIEKYCEKDEDGKPVQKAGRITVAPYNWGEFDAELTELYEVDATIEFEPIYMEDIERCETEGFDKLLGREMNALSYMIKTE